MSSTTHVEEDKKQLAKDMHRLARSRVRLKDSNEGGVVVMNMYESSLVSKVKDKKDQHPVLLELKENVLKKKVMALEKRGDRLCVPKKDEFQQRIAYKAHNSRYYIQSGSTKMYRELRQFYW